MNNIQEDIVKFINELVNKVKRFINDLWNNIKKLLKDHRIYNAYKNKLKYYKRVRNRNTLYKKRIDKYGKY